MRFSCINGPLGPDAPCNPDRPLACASGKCGCDEIDGCYCRNASCGQPGEPGDPCGSAADCCNGVCQRGRCTLLV